jgi:hypothetical protein
MTTEMFPTEKAKTIGYAYAASPYASRHGFGKTGCYCVEVYDSMDSTIGYVMIGAFATKEDAIAYANEEINCQWKNNRFQA